MLSHELTAPTTNSAPVHQASGPMRPGTRPSSTARDIRYGAAAISTIHTLDSSAPDTARPGCRRTSHHRKRQPPRQSGVPGSSYASIMCLLPGLPSGGRQP